MPVIETKGALSSQGFGEFAQSNVSANYIEDVFSTYLYTGNGGTTQLIQNNIELGSTINNGSVFFDGSSATMLTTMPPFSGDFTIEFFLYPTDPTRAYLLLDKSFRNTNFSLQTDYLNTGKFYLNVAGVFFQFNFTPPIVNQWSHIAVCRSGTDLRFFLNGTQLGTTQSSSGSILTGSLYIGSASSTGSGYSYTQGNISNLRMTNTALYTSNFTTPSSPLTAVTGTQLLTCKSPTFTTDLSPNAYSITATSTVNSLRSPTFTQPGAGKGGMVWIKNRALATDHAIFDTARGATKWWSSDLTSDETTTADSLTAFNTTGFTLGAYGVTNESSYPLTSWTFGKKEKFFTVVTYTGNGANRTISHDLGSTPGMIIVRNLNRGTQDTMVYHRSLGATRYLMLNKTDGATIASNAWNDTEPTSTTFSVGTLGNTNGNGNSLVAYLFAHDAGGFGLSGSSNVISCGTYTGNGSPTGPIVTLGYEPQWLLIKNTTGLDWYIFDTLRGFVAGSGNDSYLFPNLTAVEAVAALVNPLATGFQLTSISNAVNNNGTQYVYMAIRRGPMKRPTTGTSVFQPVVYTGTNVDNRLVTTNLITDFIMARQRNSTTLGGMLIGDRLRGNQYWLTGVSSTAVTDADSLMTPTVGYGNSFSAMNGFGCGNDATAQLNISTVTNNQIVEAFVRAPGFLDVVTYTGTGANRTVSHNLGVKPDMMWVKRLDTSTATAIVYASTVGATGYLSQTGSTAASYSPTMFNDTEPTSTQFTVATATNVNALNNAYAAYLMASVPGVSRCSYYVGRDVGTSHQVDCGFTGGARFVLIKSVGSTGSWFVYDSARGIVSGNDPYILLDSTQAEDTATDYIDSYSAGFEVSATAIDGLNRGYARDWVQQAAVAGTTNMWDVLYANGLWLVGSSNGNVYYGATGYSWTTATGVITGAVYGLAFGSNLYIAVGNGGRISTSPDSVTWTTRTSGVTSTLNGAEYGFGKYWACGDAGTLVSSSDGITWSTVSLGTTADLYRVRFVNGVLIIVGQTGTLITSSDGTTFTTRTTGITDTIRDVTFGNSTYVAVGFTGTIITSTNLSTWTARNAGALAGNNIYGVTYAGYRFVAVATAGETGYSNDGITWSTGAGAGTNPLYSVAYGNDMVIAGNGDGDLFVSDVRYFFWAIA